MAFTKSTEDLIVHQKMADYPIEDGQYTVEDLKKELDRPVLAVQRDLNNLMDELGKGTSAGDLGAEQLESTDLSAPNVQAKLRELNRRLQNVTLGQIPDGSVQTSTLADGAVTEAKISSEYTNKVTEEIEGSKAEINANLGLVSNYNEPTITYSDTYKTITEGDILPKTWETVIEGTKYKNGNIIVESERYSNGYPLVNAFDDDKKTYFSINTNANAYSYITIDFNNPICITEMYVDASENYMIIEGSNNKNNWDNLYTYVYNSSGLGSAKTRQLQNNTEYRYYRIGLHNTSTSTAKVLYCYSIKVLKYKYKAQVFNLTNDIKDYKKGMLVNIQTPSNLLKQEDCFLNINGLGERQISNIITPNSKYVLIYDGEKFVSDKSIIYDVTLTEAVTQIDLSNILEDNSGYMFLIKMPSDTINKSRTMTFSAIAPDNVSSSNPTTTFSYAYSGSNYVLPVFLFIKDSYICGMGYSDDGDGTVQQFFSGGYRIDISNLFLNGPVELFMQGTNIQIRRLY